MTVYVTYSYYGTTYGGTAIPSADFTRYATKASAFVDLATSDRVAAIITAATDTATIEKIKNAVCAVADEQYGLDQSGGVISSESVGSHSVSYSLKKSASVNTQLTDAAKPFLAGTGLMFRGFYQDELSSSGTLPEVGDL